MPKAKRPVQREVKSQRRKPEADWFRARMHERGLDRDTVAGELDIVGNSVWLMLSGKRGVRPDEIAIWSRLLDVPYLDVVRRFGFAVPDNTVAVTETLRVSGRISVRTPDQVYRVQAPPGLSAKGAAIVVEGAHTALAIFEGSHLFYERTEGVDVNAVGRLSVVETAEHGSAPIVGMLTRGSVIGQIRIIVFGGLETIESRQLVGAWPVLWQKL